MVKNRGRFVFGQSKRGEVSLCAGQPVRPAGDRGKQEANWEEKASAAPFEMMVGARDVVAGDCTPKRATASFQLPADGFSPRVAVMGYSDIITMEPGKRSGKPCIRGLRITVYDVLEYLASGMTHAEVLQEFPDLTERDIRACLAFAADRERKSETLNA